MGCIDILKEAFDQNGNAIYSVPPFTFTLDGNRTVVNGTNGRARFDDVTAGTHTVIESVPTGWTLSLVTPTNGTVSVPENACATVVFKNKQNPTTSTDFTITKTDGQSEAEPEEELTYTITVKNNANFAVSNVTVTDTLPDEVNFTSASGTYDRNGRVITWSNVTFAANETRTFTVDVEVDEDADGKIYNTAQVFDKSATDKTTITEDDDDDDNDSNDDPEIELTKEASAAEVFPGGLIEYRLRIENTGDETISDITVTDKLPANVSVIDDGDADENKSGRLEWEIDELEEGDTWTATYRVSVDVSAYPGEIIRNDVTVEADELDETESVTVSVIGNLPQTGVMGAPPASTIRLIPLTRNAGTGSTDALPIVLWVLMVGLGAGTGMGVGRKFLLGF